MRGRQRRPPGLFVISSSGRAGSARRSELVLVRGPRWPGPAPAALGSARARRRLRPAAGGGARLSGSAGLSSRWIRCTASVAAAASPGAGPAAAARTTRAVASGPVPRPAVAVSSACISTSRVICVSASRISGRKGSIWRPILRDGQQPVVVAGQVRPLVRQDGVELIGIQRLQRGGGHDHRRVRPGDAVGGWLGVVDQRGAQVRVRAPDQAGGLRVLHRLPPDGAQVGRRGERGAGQHRSGEGEAEPGHGGAARRGVGVPQPQDAGPDQVTQPAA